MSEHATEAPSGGEGTSRGAVDAPVDRASEARTGGSGDPSSDRASDAPGDRVRPGRPEAAAAIWDWRGERDDRPRRAAKMRRGGLLRAAVAAAAGAAFFYFGRDVLAYVAWSIGSLTLVLALVSPLGAYAALERAVGKVGELVGAALTWLLLAPVFYLFFAPFGLLFKRGRRDPLKRGLDVDAETYWTERERERTLEKPY